MNKTKTILVTGGVGFIGSHLVKELLRLGYQVVMVDNFSIYYTIQLKEDRLKHMIADEKAILRRVDITDLANLRFVFEEFSFDVVCHLAAQPGVRESLTNPWIYQQTNISGTLNILELMKEFKIPKLVMASSSSVYGNTPESIFCEHHNVDYPISLYAATKKSAELMSYTYHHLYGLKVAALRFFTVYGPWGRPDMSYYKFAEKMRKGEEIEIYNHGKMKRDFTYVTDVIDGIVACIEKDFDYEIFNLGNNQPEELEYFVNLLEEYLGIKAIKKYLPLQPGDVVETAADIQKAQKMLNYQPKTRLVDGLKKFADWYKEYYHLS